MISDDDVRQIVEKDDSVVIGSLMCDVIQRFVYDKTKEEIHIKQPTGAICPNASFASGQIVNDVKLMSLFYSVAKNYYLEEFKKKDEA